MSLGLFENLLSWRLSLLFGLCLAMPVRADVDFSVDDAPAGLIDNLRARLALTTEPCDAPEWRLQRRYRRADEALEPALQAFGFYSARIEKQWLTDDDCWHATFTLKLGTRTLIRQRDIVVEGEAADDPEWHRLQSELPLAPGSSLHHGDYEAIKDRLWRFAAERGYLDFRFRHSVLRIDPVHASADIDIAVDSGRRYHFGSVHFGDQPLQEDFVRRLAQVPEGDPFDALALSGIDRRLSDSGYFDRVEVRALRDQAVERAVPIDIQFDAAKRHVWRAGIGYATDTGPRASLGYENRYVNPDGYRTESLLSLSPVLSSLAVHYVVPGRDPHSDSYRFGARVQHEDTETAVSDSARLVARHIYKGEVWTQNRFLELLHERSTVDDDRVTQTLFMPGIGFDLIEADDILRARRGYRLGLELRAASKGFLSTASLFRIEGRAKGVYRFGDAGRVTGRVDVGLSMGDSVDDLPASLRFFAGGDNSVRGYAFKSLGPVGDDGEPRGGRHLLAVSLEYEHPVAGEDWWAAVFVDTGNAFDTGGISLRTGYGVGVRWYSPVGRVRLDLAFPDDTTEDQWRLHFGLGVDL